MKRMLISSGSTFEAEIGYSRAVVQGDWVFISGTTGFDYSTMTISDSLLEQTEQCLKNIESALSKAGASLRDVVRVTYVLPNGGDFSEVLASSPQVLRGSPPSGHDDFCGPFGSAHANRGRGYRSETPRAVMPPLSIPSDMSRSATCCAQRRDCSRLDRIA